MVIRYPNGQSSAYDGGKTKLQEKIARPKTFANRGMRFEEAINQSNAYYLNRQAAVIHKNLHLFRSLRWIIPAAVQL